MFKYVKNVLTNICLKQSELKYELKESFDGKPWWSCKIAFLWSSEASVASLIFGGMSMILANLTLFRRRR